MNELASIPGLAAAMEQESAQREQDFADAPVMLCGIEVQPLSLSSLMRLQLVESPLLFASGVPVTLVDIAIFFWLLSPHFEIALRWRERCETVSLVLGRIVFDRIRRRTVKRLRKVNLDDAAKACRAFVAATLDDAPGGRAISGPSYYGWPASYVGILAAEYGWAERDILAMPLRRVFQHVRRIIHAQDNHAILFNPSDRIRGAWLQAQNQRQQN